MYCPRLLSPDIDSRVYLGSDLNIGDIILTCKKYEI